MCVSWPPGLNMDTSSPLRRRSRNPLVRGSPDKREPASGRIAAPSFRQRPAADHELFVLEPQLFVQQIPPQATPRRRTAAAGQNQSSRAELHTLISSGTGDHGRGRGGGGSMLAAARSMSSKAMPQSPQPKLHPFTKSQSQSRRQQQQQSQRPKQAPQSNGKKQRSRGLSGDGAGSEEGDDEVPSSGASLPQPNSFNYFALDQEDDSLWDSFEVRRSLQPADFASKRGGSRGRVPASRMSDSHPGDDTDHEMSLAQEVECDAELDRMLERRGGDNNDDVCRSCGQQGILLTCSQCPSAFHVECLQGYTWGAQVSQINFECWHRCSFY